MAGTRRAPDTGDIVWLEFDPQSGHEQAGHRSALVMSPAMYNAKSGLMLCCPLSTKIKGYPFEVRVSDDEREGVVLSDQLKSLDWKARRAIRKARVSNDVVDEVRARIKALLAIR